MAIIGFDHRLAAAPGSADPCLRWSGPIADAARLLEGRGIAVEQGPVDRPASDGTMGRPVYFRDPDGNLPKAGR